MKKYWLVFLLLVISMALLLSGCNLIKQVQDWKNGGEETEAPLSQDPVVINQIPNQDLILDETAAEPGEQELNSEPQTPAEPEPTDPSDLREVVLYFANAAGDGLEAELRAIPKQEGIARATVNQLIAGPKDAALAPTIPAATILDDINIKDGVCIVDFSVELRDHYQGDMLAEQLTVYSIVNTLTQFDSIDQVKILVGGREIQSIAGHIDVSEAMARNHNIIK